MQDPQGLEFMNPPRGPLWQYSDGQSTIFGEQVRRRLCLRGILHCTCQKATMLQHIVKAATAADHCMPVEGPQGRTLQV